MPQLPQLRDIRSASVGVPQTPDIRPARGLMEGLDAIGDASREALDTIRKKQDEDDRIAAHKAQTELRAKISTDLITRQGSGDDLSGLTEKLPVQIQQDWAKASTGLSKGAKRYFDQFLPDALAQFQPMAARAEVDYKNTKREADITSSFESARSTILTAPQQFPSLYAQNAALLNNVSLPTENMERLKARLGGLAFSYAQAIGRTNPAQAKQVVASGQLDQYGLDPDQKSRLIDDFDREARQRVTEARVAQAAASAGAASSLMVEINRFRNGQGDFSQAALDGARKTLSADAFNRLQMQFDDARAYRDGQDADRLGVAQKIESGGRIDPNNQKEAAAFDEYFQRSIMPKIREDALRMPEDKQAQAVNSRVLAFIQEQGVAPKSLVSNVRATLRGGSPAERAEAARTIEQLRTVAPRALNDFDAETIRQANLIGSYVDGGMSPAAAVTAADEALRRPKVAEDALRATYKAQTKDDTTTDWLASQYSGWWESAAVPPAVAAQVSDLVQNEYIRNGGNLEAARKTALDLTKRRFGPSSINGALEVVRNPIEQHYRLPWQSPSEAVEAIKKEAIEDVSRGGATDGPLGADMVRISPYPARGVTAPDGRPVYAIAVQNTAGEWTVQMDMDEKSPTFGLPKPWFPSQGKAKSARDAVVKQAIEGAKISRKAITDPILPQAGIQ